jgi:Zn finger protein HypA/HybF involved in hydrogenase expression
MECLNCHTPLELAPSQLYARCPSCQLLFMNVAGNWQLYPVDQAEQESIERSLGFSNTAGKSTK